MLLPGYALYMVSLIHHDSRSVIKVVRYGLNIVCFPDEHIMELVDCTFQFRTIVNNKHYTEKRTISFAK
jgi:hypothetical protein